MYEVITIGSILTAGYFAVNYMYWYIEAKHWKHQHKVAQAQIEFMDRDLAMYGAGHRESYQQETKVNGFVPPF